MVQLTWGQKQTTGDAFRIPSRDIREALKAHLVANLGDQDRKPRLKMLLLFFSFFPLIAITVIAAPTPADDAPAPDASILTSFKFAGCSDDQANILNQNVKDAVALASAGLDYVNDELVDTYPQYGHQQVNFSKQAAIDFFGPESQNRPYQQFIFLEPTTQQSGSKR